MLYVTFHGAITNIYAYDEISTAPLTPCSEAVLDLPPKSTDFMSQWREQPGQEDQRHSLNFVLSRGNDGAR